MTERKTFLRGIPGTGGQGGLPRTKVRLSRTEYYTVLPQPKDLAFWWRIGPQEDFGFTQDSRYLEGYCTIIIVIIIVTVDSICYELRRETGCVPEEEKLVAYQRKKTGCVPEEGNWLRTRKRESGCVPGVD